ncbi:epoxide hydrolase family protein [Nocardioides flavescens]|uniref:epoxide hydrolase family protein n=1 Tax=Nocardioides flavescens TaxID=2691959 RepID=UPI00301BD9B8
MTFAQDPSTTSADGARDVAAHHDAPTVRPHPIRVAPDRLTDLRRRLADTRWPDRETASDQGPGLDRLQELVAYWADGYDWRRAESVLNAAGSSVTTIDGVDVHLLHVRSPEPGALPLMLCHGWPGSVLEFAHLLGPLTDPVAHGGRAEDAFHVVVPSMPGFGFSGAPTSEGWGPRRIAAAWAELMPRLGYDRWVAQGGDWGSAVVEALRALAPAGLVGTHVNLPMVFPTPEEMADATAEERAMIARAERYQTSLDAYAREMATRPQTIGYALADSPVALLAWIVTLFDDVSDSEVDRDDVLDDVMLYWLPNAGASAARLYWEARREPYAATGPSPLPAGFSVFPGEQVRASRRWVERRYPTVLHYGQPPRGGHFAALEEPELLTGELRTTFRALR